MALICFHKCPRHSPLSVSTVITPPVNLLHGTLCSMQVALMITYTTSLLATDTFLSWPALHFSANCATVDLLCGRTRQTSLRSKCINEPWALMTLRPVSFLTPRKKVLSSVVVITRNAGSRFSLTIVMCCFCNLP